jgi:hypothetical protein
MYNEYVNASSIHARLASRVALPRSPPHPSRVRATLHVLVEMSVEMQQHAMQSRESHAVYVCLHTLNMSCSHTYTQRARQGINTTICCPLSHLPPNTPFTLLPPSHLPTTFMPIAGRHIKK